MKEISAGGVVFRKNGKDRFDIMLIEDRYARASFPKGKQERGETIEETALREIKEETGIDGEIVKPLKVVYYDYEHPEKGTVDKEVHYYLVRALTDHVIVQQEEIAQVHWHDPEDAVNIQDEKGYGNNRDVLQAALRHLHTI